MTSLYQRPVLFQVHNGNNELSRNEMQGKFWSHQLVGPISIEPSSDVVRSALTDAYVVQNEVRTWTIPAGSQVRFPLKNMPLFSFSLQVADLSSMLSKVQVELRDDKDATLYVFRPRDQVTSMPWAWNLGNQNPLVLPEKISARFIVITAVSHTLKLNFQPLHFAKGSIPFNLGRQPLLVQLSGNYAWLIEDGYRDRVVRVPLGSQ